MDNKDIQKWTSRMYSKFIDLPCDRVESRKLAKSESRKIWKQRGCKLLSRSQTDILYT